MKKLIILLCSLALIFSMAAVASAIPISGGLYTGGLIIDPLFDPGTATELPSITSMLTFGTGHLSSLTGMPLTTNLFTFNPAGSPAANPLWTLGDFSFVLDKVAITLQSSTQLALKGVGTMSLSSTSTISGLDPTLYTWSMSLDQGKASFFFSQAQVPAPEPATMLLLGTGLAGLVAVVRRRKARKA